MLMNKMMAAMSSGNEYRPSKDSKDDYESNLDYGAGTTGFSSICRPVGTTLQGAQENQQRDRNAASTDNQMRETKRIRRRFPDPTQWKANVRKHKKWMGEEYVSRNGKIIPAVEIKKVDCSKCRLKCTSNITVDQQIDAHNAYRKLSSNEAKWNYVSALVDREASARKTTGNEMSRRHFSLRYHLYIRNKRIQVCKKYFLATLAISEKVVQHVTQKRSEQNIVPNDRRGNHSPARKITEAERQHIRDHINSFPKVPADNGRKSNSKQYLNASLSLRIMYELYCQYCQENGFQVQKRWLYEVIFKGEFNLDFHTPRKNECRHMTAKIAPF